MTNEVPIYETFGGGAMLYVGCLISLILLCLLCFQALGKRYEFLLNRRFRLSFLIAHLLVILPYSYIWRGYSEMAQGIFVWFIPGIFDFPSSILSIIYPIPLFAILGSIQYYCMGMIIDEYSTPKRLSQQIAGERRAKTARVSARTL